MDQLRDTINLRAFSQQDPRIEYKREGSKLFLQMLESVRDRVTDMIFRAKVNIGPQTGGPGMPSPSAGARPMPPAAAAPMRPAPVAAAGAVGAGASPYYTPPSRPAATPGAAPATNGAARASTPYYEPPQPTATAAPAAGMITTDAAPMSRQAQRDLEAAQRAGTDPNAKQAPVVKSGERFGRNDPCPMGCGRKYKKCCNKPDGSCDGTGMNAPSSATPDDDEE
jgi:preprotein translocase subunit SecA